MPEPEFKYIAGDLSLDFVNTVDWTADGLAEERLTAYDALTRWAEGADFLTREAAARLRSRAARDPRRAQATLATALRLRSLLQRIFSDAATNRIQPNDLLALNQYLTRAARQRNLVPHRGRLHWHWRGLGDQLDSILWPVVWSASDLLTSEDASQIRSCGGPSCGWLFVDRSRNRLRRWCQMETCGTREKSRRRAER